MIWNTSLPDWESRLLSGQSLIPELPLFADEAAGGLSMFRRLQIPDVVGTPRFRDIAGQWVFDFVEALFGSYDPETDKRYIQEFFLLVPKKNGKSTIAAGIMVTAVLLCRRPEAEFMFLAPTLEVAGISFRQARGIIRLDKTLTDRFHVQDNIRRITLRHNGSFLQIKAADLDVVTGSKPVGTLIDETHVFSTHSRAADVFLECRGALAARPDGFLLQISTQSKAPPAGVFKSELQRARDVRDGRLTLPKPLLPVLYELPASCRDDWENEKYWPIINPNLGRSVDIDFLRSSLIDSKRKGMADTALFASQHFNVEIGQLLRGDRWAGSEFWDKQTDPTLTLETLIERSEIIVLGLDGGGLDDLYGLAALGRSRDDPQVWLAWSHAWCHESVLQRRQTIAATLQDFAAAGELTICDNSLEDISAIVTIAQTIKQRGKLACVAVDPAGLGSILGSLSGIEITVEGKQVIGVGQGYQLMNAIKTTERMLANGTLWHSKSSLMNWAVGNVAIEHMATSIRPTKANAGDAKIDPVCALWDAASVLPEMAKAPTYHLSFI